MSEYDSYYTHQYITGQKRSTHPGLLSDFEALSAEMASKEDCTLDLSYGNHPRQVMDVFYTSGEPKGTVLYFHAGYWQSRDKSTFRFLAKPFLARGYDFALVNYPLCPGVSLENLLVCAAQSIPALGEHMSLLERAKEGLILAGHSAGGHIACELAIATERSVAGDRHEIRGIVAISGIYDLVPLVSTSLNERLQLSIEDAATHSPIRRVAKVGIRAHFVVGGDETVEFKRQSKSMADAWQAAGNEARYTEVNAADHFSVLEVLASDAAAYIP